MSYARLGLNSDVYVYPSIYGPLECCGCRLHEDGLATFATTEAMIAHLREHEAAGDKVPARTFESLEADRADNDAYAATKAASEEGS